MTDKDVIAMYRELVLLQQQMIKLLLELQK